MFPKPWSTANSFTWPTHFGKILSMPNYLIIKGMTVKSSKHRIRTLAAIQWTADLVESYSNMFGINLHKLSHRILQTPGNRHGRSQIWIKIRHLFLCCGRHAVNGCTSLVHNTSREHRNSTNEMELMIWRHVFNTKMKYPSSRFVLS